jgi:hypothetical protein
MTSGQKSLLITVAVALVVGLSAGAYLLGKAGGEDLDAARAISSAVAERDGTTKGRAQGYNVGETQGYKEAYPPAYKAAYRKSFEDAGQPPPEDITVPASTLP